MFSYTHENHFEFGYDGRPFASRASAHERFSVAYGRCLRPPGDFREECLRAARLVSDSTDLVPNVLFSGGADSEVVVRSFLEAGVPVKVSVLRFRNGLNQHDIRHALEFCDEAGIEPDIVDLDLLRFWESGLFDYARVSHSVSPQFCTTMWLCDQVDGLPVIGSGECFLAVEGYVEDVETQPAPRAGASWFLWEREKVASWYRFFMNSGRPGVPGFFQYTPELMYSYLSEDWTRRLVSGRVAGALENASTKLRIYCEYFPVRPRPKYTGFEMVMEYDRSYRSELERLYGPWSEIARTEFESLLIDLRFEPSVAHA